MSTVKVNTISTWTGNDISIETGKTVSGTASQFKMTDVVQGDVLYGSAADTLSRLAPGTAGQVLQTQGAGANPVWAADAGLFASYALLQDQKTQNTAGGTFTTGAWQTRDLQTEVYDGIGITISSNEFTLPAGSYLIKWSAPSYSVGTNQSRLYDVTGSAAAGQGSSLRVPAAVDYRSDTTPSTGSARVAPGSSNAYRIEHYCGTTFATYGFGYPANFGVEVYTQIEIYKEL